MKARAGPQCQMSTPKPKLMVTAQYHVKELSTKIQRVPHGAYVRMTGGGSSQVTAWGSRLPRWSVDGAPSGSRSSSVISLDDHEDFTTTELMRRDQPSEDHAGDSGDIEIMEIGDAPSDDADKDMGSTGGEAREHTQDSSQSSSDSGAGSGSGSDSGSDSDHDSNRSSDHGSHPGSNSGSDSDSGSSSSDEGNKHKVARLPAFADMFNTPKKPTASKKPEKKSERHWESSSHSRSQETDGSK